MNICISSLENSEVIDIIGKDNVAISSVIYDSRKAAEGSAFICVSGENHDGHDYIEQAIEKGAVLIAGENAQILKQLSIKYSEITFVIVRFARDFLAQLSIQFHSRAHEKITTVGVTGTNGKTTVTAYVRSLMNQLGTPSTLIGTNGVLTSKGKMDFQQTTPTTPEAPDLHGIFEKIYTHGDRLAAMEVSSVAIEQKRTAGIPFDVAIHTNLSPEHLEFHHTFENYKKAKLKLFQQAKTAVVNIDDSGMGRDILKCFSGPVITYSLDRHSGADIIAMNMRTSGTGTSFELRIQNKSYIVRAPIFGDYNVANLLSAIGTAVLLGHSLPSILYAIPRIEGPEGRFEVLQQYGSRNIILDYAHTPVALTNLLAQVKKLPHKRLIVMIAGIGIRDRDKMPKMAEVIEGHADEVVVTVDHPGFNDPNEIVSHVITGFKNQHAVNVHRAPTRREGVLSSLALSREGDLVVLTSGCINGAQIVKGEKIPHSDKDIIAEYFEQHREDFERDYVEA
ncbi:UDP-N-acetylmuramoyl-L-alanyl-D-glutamate--2,6-diaminopimelate ligase [Fictibacillus aquaticus]|uniref:UDP-N-acetylmuramyl-tripeptide synthetase n=1 Tax=Fictibacillus aquaticus TaxID=2021314 RepID=A0A235F7D8_9BACL|nr:UDP-N-acetylmuramoyl-L-alanyl-D-glutamate--2,6-diaminopimelate ligase [Fictibacillus aquaticus]OYD57256.1 UDP-N-acetylmuramoyl-L-alanyl-D-glutamate--2,6-diaminopimelate ligase [Fictibacillus aquaticus]